jgi:hypothetical protein
MHDGLDWLWRPVLRGVFRGESLFDGSIGLVHIAQANEALDVMDENRFRFEDANKHGE